MKKNVLAIAVGLLLFIPIFISIKPIQISGIAMLPGYNNGEKYIVNKLAYVFSAPSRGDVIMFSYPGSSKYKNVGRIVGLPGETLKIQGGKVFINDVQLAESYLNSDVITKTKAKSQIVDISDTEGKIKEIPNTTPILQEGVDFQIPPNNYFIMGDNRENSADSRDFDTVMVKDIVGKLTVKY